MAEGFMDQVGGNACSSSNCRECDYAKRRGLRRSDRVINLHSINNSIHSALAQPPNLAHRQPKTLGDGFLFELGCCHCRKAQRTLDRCSCLNLFSIASPQNCERRLECFRLADG